MLVESESDYISLYQRGVSWSSGAEASESDYGVHRDGGI